MSENQVLFDDAQSSLSLISELAQTAYEALCEEVNPCSEWGFAPTFTMTASNTSNSQGTSITFKNLQEEICKLKNENAHLHLEMEDFDAFFDMLLEEDDLSVSDVFLLGQRQRMQERGWEIAFLSPSVVDSLRKSSTDEFTESGFSFFYTKEDNRG